MDIAANAPHRAVLPPQKHAHAPKLSRVGESSTETGPLVGEADVDQLFDALGVLFGWKFTSQWGAFDESGVWMAELAFLTRRHLELGIKRCREAVQEATRMGNESWPPQPAAFAILCEPCPEDFGMPGLEEAWREVCAHAHEPTHWHWSHETVRMAGSAVGWWDLTHSTAPSAWSRLERHFTQEYGALVNRLMNGEQLVAYALLESDSNRSPADLAERAGHEAANRAVKAAGLPHRMSSAHGLTALRNAVGKT